MDASRALAPADLKFFSSGGREVASKNGLSKEISKSTSIGKGYLNGTDLLAQASIAKRMSWASRRETTRSEDLAYCLLEIFDINMPLLHGEGEKAFVRLQEEIMKNSDDQSLFAWGYNKSPLPFPPNLPDFLDSYGPFASSPAAFKDSGHIIPDELEPPTTAFTMTNRGPQISLRANERLSRFSTPEQSLHVGPNKSCFGWSGFPSPSTAKTASQELDQAAAGFFDGTR
jgi:hypothetical protein